MAIRRCPYCKAIIDEGLEYCSNCGTQLIFPEDELVEEEIPGEKIVDVTEEGDDPEKEQFLEESQDLDAENEDVEDEMKTSDVPDEDDIEVELSEATGEEETARNETNEKTSRMDEYLVDNSETEEEIEHNPETEGEIISEEIEGEIEKPVDFEEETESEEEISEEEEPKTVESPAEQLSDSTEKSLTEEFSENIDIDQVEEVFTEVEDEADEVSAQREALDFKTEELEKIDDSAEKEKEEIEQFLNSLKEEREKTKKYYEETGELPPWAQSMKDVSLSTVSSEENSEEAEEPFAEETSTPSLAEMTSEKKIALNEEKIKEEEVNPVEEVPVSTDTGIGLPEGVDQKGLSFNQNYNEDKIGEETETPLRKAEMNFKSWIKSRIFDILMISSVWLITVWLASVVVKVSFFQLMTASTIQLLIFLAILIFIYFFLFFFFLGETLGDQLFSQEE